MLAYGLVRECGVADTRQKRPTFVNLETSQEVGRSRPSVANMCRPLVFARVFRVSSDCPPDAGPRRRPPPPTASSSIPARGGELVASIRSEPATYNRYTAAGAAAATDVVTFLTQARLVRVNRATDELEPWLAECWTSSPDGLTHTIMLRPGIQFSDGEPFTSADVLFSFRAAYDPDVASPLGSALTVHDKPLEVTAPDARTVVVRFPEPLRARAPAARQPPDPSATQARAGSERQAIPERLGAVEARHRRRGPRTVSARRARRGTTSRLCPQPALLPPRPWRSSTAVPRSPDARHRSRPGHRGASA